MDAGSADFLARRLSIGLAPGNSVCFTTAGDGFDAGDRGVVTELDTEAYLVRVVFDTGRSVIVHPSLVQRAA
jgi:hypothetical protein